MTVANFCGAGEARCLCEEPENHNGPHRCKCGGSWHVDNKGRFHIDSWPGTAEDWPWAIAARHPSAPSGGGSAWLNSDGPHEMCSHCRDRAAYRDGLCWACARKGVIACDPVSGQVRPAESDDREASVPDERSEFPTLWGFLSRSVRRWLR